MSFLLNTLTSVPASDWYTSGIAIVLIAFLLAAVEIGFKFFDLPSLYTRKFIHIVTGLIICIVAYFLVSNLPIILFATFYIFVDIWSLKKGKFKSIHPDTRSYGTLFYAISVIMLAFFFWGESKPLFILTNLIMILPDAMAAIMGEQFAKRFFVPVGDKKSIIGASTMYLLTFLIVFMFLKYVYESPLEEDLLIALIIAAIATVAELISYRGSDNLSVPILSGLFLYVLLIIPESDIFKMIVIGTILAAFVAVLSLKFKFLDPGGAALAFLMGSIIFGFGGFAYTVPILGFFFLSSFLSKIGRARKKQYESSYQKTGIRDFYQALANGGVATVIVLIAFFTGIDSFYSVYLCALAAATADTWGTELGIFSKSKPILIINFREVEPGTSGGISFIGSISALVGSMIIICIGNIFYEFTFGTFFLLTFIGFAGSLVDSFLGATFQGQYSCIRCGKVTEGKIHCNVETTLVKGYRWFDNDFVNIFSISISAFLSFILIF